MQNFQIIPPGGADLFIFGVLAKTALLTLYCLVVGRAIHRFMIAQWPIDLMSTGADTDLTGHRNLYLQSFFDICLGLAAITTMLFVLGIASALYPGMVALMLALMLLVAIFILSSCKFAGKDTAHVQPTAATHRWTQAAEALFVASLFVYLVMLAIKVPGLWDDTSYHLPYARYYLDQHAILINPYLRFPLFPHNGNILLTLGLMYGTVVDAQAIATLPLFVISLGLLGACRAFARSSTAGYLAVFVFLQLGPLQETMGYAYIDNILALYALGAILALAMWLNAPQKSGQWLVTCGILAGMAAGTKIFGGVLAFLIGLYLLLFVRKFKPVALYALTTFAMGSWWYIRSAYISGDPVHPAGGNIFGHYLWNAVDLLAQQQEQYKIGSERTIGALFQGMQKANIAVLVPALLIILHPKARSRPLVGIYLIFVSYLVFWLLTAQVPRYMAPILAAGVLLTILLLYYSAVDPILLMLSKLLGQFAGGIVSRAGPATVALFAAVIVGSLLSKGIGPVRHQLVHWNAILKERAGYEVMIEASSLRPAYGDTLLQIGYESSIYFYTGLAIGDLFGPGRYSQMTQCSDLCRIVPEDALASLMARFGTRMVAINTRGNQLNPQAYSGRFDVKFKGPDGYLLVLRQMPDAAPLN